MTLYDIRVFFFLLLSFIDAIQQCSGNFLGANISDWISLVCINLFLLLFVAGVNRIFFFIAKYYHFDATLNETRINKAKKKKLFVLFHKIQF